MFYWGKRGPFKSQPIEELFVGRVGGNIRREDCRRRKHDNHQQPENRQFVPKKLFLRVGHLTNN